MSCHGVYKKGDSKETDMGIAAVAGTLHFGAQEIAMSLHSMHFIQSKNTFVVLFLYRDNPCDSDTQTNE